MKKIIYNLGLAFVILFLNYVRCETDNCNFNSCGECISSASDRCVWCSQDNAVIERRCVSESLLKTNLTWCKPASIYNPEPKNQTVTDQDFGKIIKEGVKVQFRPQLIKMTMRPGIPQQFDMYYRPATDFPLDVYYLIDVSYTMSKQVETLKKEAKAIYDALRKYTNNVRLGIGSFVEKPCFPFFDVNVHKGHAFKNELSLTNNMTLFENSLGSIEFGSNYDPQEAGLDGLMQAMKCDDQIGWRPGARSIIILYTDAPYHSAGDGKIVGAVIPHDMECHLQNNMYTKADILDYPSVSQINKVATDSNFRIIFAIARADNTNKLYKDEYENLANQIEGSRFTELRGDNVLKIIKEVYEELGNSIPIKYTAPSYVEVSLDQNCISKPKINCESPHNQTVHITGTLKVKSCPTKSETERVVTLIPSGQYDTLTIELDIKCQCDCETQGGLPNPRCNGMGFLQCGICKCDPGRYGADCRCSGSSTDKKDMEKCRFRKEDKNLCNGRSPCRCGKCVKCKTGFSGDFCEFDDNSCPKSNNIMCSGHGTCVRGQCQCKPHWKHGDFDDCSCTDKSDDCIAPYSNQVCSDRGSCHCGVCKCNAVEGKNETYSGPFCDNCEDCAKQLCIQLEDYAYCNYMNMDNKALCDEKSNQTTRIGVSFVNKTVINGPKLYMAKWCKKELDSNNGTYIVFKYYYENHDLKLTIQKELELPPEADIWVAAGSAIGLVLLIGIITVIIWKVLVDLHDKREYDKFSNEAKAAGYDVSCNPLYLDPAINFSNPVYNNDCN